MPHNMIILKLKFSVTFFYIHVCTLRWNPPGQIKQGRPKMTLRKTFKGDFKKIDLTWGTAEREAKERRSWRKRSICIILNG